MHENVVSVVGKLAASRADRRRTANFAIHDFVSTVLSAEERFGWGLLWESGQQSRPREVMFGPRTWGVVVWTEHSLS